MEQEDAYIAYEDRTPKDLCQDINIKAEKLHKSNKRGLFVITVIFLVLVALSLHYMPKENWWKGLGVLGVVEVSFFVIYIYTQKLIHEMHLAANPKQFLPIAQKLKECVRCSNYFFHVISLWVTITLLPELRYLWWWPAAALIISAGLALLIPFTEKEVALRDEVDDLERSLASRR